MDEEDQEKIESWQKVKAQYEDDLEGTEGRDREAIENKIDSCKSLIEQLYEKENPTKKKEMYK